MLSQVLERKDIKKHDTWDLESLFDSLEAWEGEYKRVSKLADEFVKHKGKVTESGGALLEALRDKDKLLRAMENVYVYSHLLLDQDTRNPKSQEISEKAMKLYIGVNEKTSFFLPELLASQEEEIKIYISENNGLEVYKQYLEDITRLKPHVLSARDESILAQMGEVGTMPEKIYSMLNNADLKFPKITNEEGKEIEISHGNFIPLMESNNREVRKSAFKSLYKTYKGFENTFATILSGDLKNNIVNARLRNFSSSMEASLKENNIPMAVYHKLIESIHDNLDGMYDYMEIRKKVLELDEVHMYDIYRPIVKDFEFKIRYDESVELVRKALAPLGEEYLAAMNEGFESRWIDIYENKGKRSGAYSSGSYDSKPYILLNYHETMDNLFTLAHEMGHSIHSYFTRKYQPYIYGNYSIFVAEVASTVNELLLLDYMIKNSQDKNEKLYLINHYLESFRTTVFRQTMFAEFEKKINEDLEAGIGLTAEYLSNIYLELNKKYYGPNTIVDEEIAIEWARIPHFYYNFYVYQYATGFSAAVDLSQKIIKNENNDVEKYLEFLKSGSSDYPINILKKAGIDMTREEPVNNAMKKFKDLIREFDSLIK